jgi:hypothetical protein
MLSPELLPDKGRAREERRRRREASRTSSSAKLEDYLIP